MSTTHTTVGATIGFALATYGGGAVNWVGKKATFPFVGGLVSVFLSWIVSPLVAGAFVTLLFLPLRAIVLRSPRSFERGLYVLPVCVFIMFFVLVVFIAQTGSKNNQWRDLSDGTACWISAAVAGGLAICAALITFLYLKPAVIAADAAAQAKLGEIKARRAEQGEVDGKDMARTSAQLRVQAMADIDAAAMTEQSAFGKKVSAAWANFKATSIGDLLVNNVVSKTISHGANYKARGPGGRRGGGGGMGQGCWHALTPAAPPAPRAPRGRRARPAPRARGAQPLGASGASRADAPPPPFNPSHPAGARPHRAG